MKNRIGIVVVAVLSTHLIVGSELNTIPFNITWHDCKKIINNNQKKIIGGIIATLISCHFYFQYRILQKMTYMNAVMHTNYKIQEVDTLHAILTQDDLKKIIKEIEQFLGNNPAITIDLLLDKLHICWHNPQDYGKPALNMLEQLLAQCQQKYDYPPDVETHRKKKGALECVLIPVEKSTLEKYKAER